jgi:hypothetical protein
VNLSDIQAQLTALMNRRDFTANTALQLTFINQGIQRIQRELRCPAMEKTITVTIGSSYSALAGITIPSDLLELQYILPLSANVSDDDKLTKCDIGVATRGSQVTGIPAQYCRDVSSWILAPSPVANDQIKIVYWAELPPLVNSTDTNVISIIAWDLIVYAALVQAAVYFKDSRKDDFEEQYGMILGDLQNQSDEDDENSGAVVQPAYCFPTEWQFDHY